MDVFGTATRTWFDETFERPTAVQAEGWPKIAGGENALLIAPTGSGKTLAAFLYCIDRLSRTATTSPGTRVLYISPLKALVYDVERNLRSPLSGLDRTARRAGVDVRIPTVGVRTGDTSPQERRRMLKHPPEILVTTPESLYLLLGSQARETLRTVETVIVDEVHALAPTKRGAHLAISLERLTQLCNGPPQRIGLSATATPLTVVADFLGGGRPVALVDTSSEPSLDVEIVVPVEDMARPNVAPAEAEGELLLDADEVPEPKRNHGLWPAIHPRLLELIRQHRSTIVFVNSRGLCERLTFALNELAEEPLVRSHHGSLAREQRKEIEESLKSGDIRGIVATSSLELGIDMGAVDLVLLVESPGSVARGLQRIGRAGHHVGEQSKGRIFPKHRADLLECAVVARRMRSGSLEPIALPLNALDVLAQQIVAMCSVAPMSVDEVERVVRGAANYRTLPRDALIGVLDMLSGRYPSSAFADLRPRLLWDRERDVLTARKGAKQLALINGGTIPDRGAYTVQLGEGGPRLGELDEEMVHETTPGQTFTLGTSTWRVEQITRDRVYVSPAPGESGKLPFWHGDGPGRPIELGRAVGEFVRKLDRLSDERADAWLQGEYALDALAAKNLRSYVREQKAETGTLPTDKAVTIERFRDELGDWRICILTPFGGRIHAPWAMALGASLSARAGFEVQTMWSDDGIVLRFVELDDLPAQDVLVPKADEVEDLVVEQLGSSALFASHFRENAGRSLLLPKRRPGERKPLWTQRLKAQELLAVAKNYPAFPVLMETYRACLKDVFDVPAFLDLLRRIESREIKVDVVETPSPSPFARSLVFAYVANYMYAGDSPVAERRAQALSLDRRLLAELLGSDELRELLDAAVIDEVEAELQRVHPDRRVRHIDGLHDALRQLGDLTAAEVAERADGDADEWLRQLVEQHRALRIRVGGEPRFIAAEDAAMYRDGLGSQLPVGVPSAFLDIAEQPVSELFLRYARTHSPFVVQDLSDRYRLPADQVKAELGRLVREEKLLQGNYRPGGVSIEWCHADVLRRIKRRTLAKLREDVEPVDAAVLARFLPEWHGVGEGRGGLARLEEVLVQLEGLPMSYAELERAILPARVDGFQPRMLDELGAMGWLVWVGHKPLSGGDGKVALYRRDRIAMLHEVAPLPEELERLPHAILAELERRGACFFMELASALAPVRSEELLEALWDLVWQGQVTNDTLQPLRAVVKGAGRTKASMARARARSRERSLPAAAGRWSLVRNLMPTPASVTERAHARAVSLLERHGVLTREVASVEPMVGGFSALYRVLREMEEAGRVRRGYFIDGLGGAQFAFSGAVDRLRQCRDAESKDDARLLAAADPANPYGWLLPWPALPEGVTGTPKRAAGAHVVMVSGHPVLFLDRGGKSLLSFASPVENETIARAGKLLVEVARHRRGRMLRVEKINGEPARRSEWATALGEAGFVADHRGLVLEAPRTSR